jgi:tetraacyldisaccharide 4'-kinase
VFRAGVFLRRAAYRLKLLRAKHPGIPVIVVGNLVVGGSGKTPLVLWIAEFLRAQGWTPGIVSRGYGARDEVPRAATIVSDAAQVGDEPIVLARRSGCPVWVGPERVRVAAALRASNPQVDVLVLDDGLQHYAIARDVEIAVVGERGFGNGFLLPAGPLREPRSRLRAVDAVVTHGAPEIEGYAMRLEGDLMHRMLDASDRRRAQSFAGQRVHAVAGIGDPERFFRSLAALGMQVVPHPFPDHHPFRPADLEFGDDAPIVMTDKDAVKCRGFAKPNFWVLPVGAVLDARFGDWLLHKLGGPRRGGAR